MIPDSLGRMAAIARETLIAAVRTRVVAALAAALAVIAFALPLMIRGDGSPESFAAILLRYTLGTLITVTGAALLWISSSSIARDVRTRRLWLTAVKPVRAWDIWFGRWIGLCTLAAGATALSGTLLLLITAGHGLGKAPEASRLPAAHLRVTPEVPGLEEEISARLAEFGKKGWIPGHVPPATARRIVRRQLLMESAAVEHGRDKTWAFTLPEGIARDAPGEIRIRTLPELAGDLPPLSGWSLATGATSIPLPRADVRPDGSLRIELPPLPLQPGLRLSIRYDNIATPSRTVVFDPESGVTLHLRAGSFLANLGRSLILLWCRLCLLAAVGLTAGSLFSAPVAVFASAALVSAALAGQALGGAHSGAPADPDLFESMARPARVAFNAAERMAGGIATVSRPLLEQNALGLLADGLRVSWADTARMAVLVFPVYGCGLGLLAVLVLLRRELAAGAKD